MKKKYYLIPVLAPLALALTTTTCRHNHNADFTFVVEDSLKNAADSTDTTQGAQAEAAEPIEDTPEPELMEPEIDPEMEEVGKSIGTYMQVPDIPEERTADKIMSQESKNSAHRAEKLYSGQSLD